MKINTYLFDIADQIAQKHVKQKFFESSSAHTVRIVKLRTEIYNALIDVSEIYKQEEDNV